MLQESEYQENLRADGTASQVCRRDKASCRYTVYKCLLGEIDCSPALSWAAASHRHVAASLLPCKIYNSTQISLVVTYSLLLGYPQVCDNIRFTFAGYLIFLRIPSGLDWCCKYIFPSHQPYLVFLVWSTSGLLLTLFLIRLFSVGVE